MFPTFSCRPPLAAFRFALGFTLVFAGNSHAQTPPSSPLDGNFGYTSPVSQYQKLATESTAEPASWPAANHKVQQIGGWRAYAKLAQQAAPSSPAAAVSTATTAADPHAHHHGGKP